MVKTGNRGIKWLVFVDSRVSISRLLLLTGVILVFVYTGLFLNRALRLSDDLFVACLGNVSALLSGLTALLGVIYGFAKWLNGRGNGGTGETG